MPTELNVHPAEIVHSGGKLDTVLIETAIAKGARQVVLICRDVEQSWKNFCDQFEIVRAAGGLILNEEKKLLFIFRHGKWDLPKGKIEEGEKTDVAAIREIGEECSLFDLVIRKELCTTWHTYIQEGIPMLKPTTWFLITHHGPRQPFPQLNEGITEINWISVDNLHMVRNNTYPSILDVIDTYIKQVTIASA